MKKNDLTPLSALSIALCKEKDSQLFNNRVIMYQLLIHFISDQLSSFSNSYAPSGIDDLIHDIRRYLLFMYSHPSQKNWTSDSEAFCSMHKYIYDNLAIYDSDVKMSPYYGKASLLSTYHLGGEVNLESNICHVLNNDRSIPKSWIRLLRNNSSDYTQILYRCFWMLQYFFVYYGDNICTISYNTSLQNQSSSRFVEYFSFNPNISTNVYNSLKKYCNSYTDFFHKNNSESIDFLSLARIILDIIIKQVELRQHVNLNNVTTASNFIIKSQAPLTESAQLSDFYKYVGGFGSDSYDRYNMLLKFAPTNCYAADELATMYYWGKTYWIRDNNYFELEQNYEKAAKWYIKAIENSNPPLQSSCWSLAYTLLNMHYDSVKEKDEAEAKALEYLNLAGEYPAAYNLVAWFTFRDAEELFTKYAYSPEYYEDILIQFLTAIRLADRAGSMHWFYGNNQIAIFLTKHKSDKKLLSDLNKRLSLHIPFEAEAQLKQAASYNNPWALKHLAIYYFDQGRKEEAFSLFKKAMASNYNSAFYETAIRFYETGSIEWKNLLCKASDLSYPRATFALAENESDSLKQKILLDLCKQQILTERQLDTDLLRKLNAQNITNRKINP
ncbi:MAG: tetratricopeptide repeat protein [Lachnospiraceae bacterium]|nr:tetratricopeptide repeat protein [Lachnospiraceae bacterium]